MKLPAPRVDNIIRPGVVSVPHGHEHTNVNLLTNAQEVDRLTGTVHYSGIPVSVLGTFGSVAHGLVYSTD